MGTPRRNLAQELGAIAQQGYIVTSTDDEARGPLEKSWYQAARLIGLPFLEVLKLSDGVQVTWVGEHMAEDDVRTVRGLIERIAYDDGGSLTMPSRAVATIVFKDGDEALARSIVERIASTVVEQAAAAVLEELRPTA